MHLCVATSETSSDEVITARSVESTAKIRNSAARTKQRLRTVRIRRSNSRWPCCRMRVCHEKLRHKRNDVELRT